MTLNELNLLNNNIKNNINKLEKMSKIVDNLNNRIGAAYEAVNIFAISIKEVALSTIVYKENMEKAVIKMNKRFSEIKEQYSKAN